VLHSSMPSASFKGEQARVTLSRLLCRSFPLLANRRQNRHRGPSVIVEVPASIRTWYAITLPVGWVV
jgi:hypothetical protein